MADISPPPPPADGTAPGSPGDDAVAQLNQAWQAAIEAEALPDAGPAAWPVHAAVIDAVDAAGLQALLSLEPPPVPAEPKAGPRLRLVPSPLRPVGTAATDPLHGAPPTGDTSAD